MSMSPANKALKNDSFSSCIVCVVDLVKDPLQRRKLLFATLIASALFTLGCRNASETSTTDTSIQSQIADVRSDKTNAIKLTEALPPVESFKALGKLNKLNTLQFDAGLKSPDELFDLTANQNVKHFRLRLTPVNEDAFVHLTHCFPRLNILNLPVLQVNDWSATDLDQLTDLTSLRIGGTCINSDAIKVIGRLPKLQHLHLIQPTLIDADLESLAAIDSLQSLYVDGCKLSEAAWQKLFTQRPKLHVHLDQAHLDYDPAKH